LRCDLQTRTSNQWFAFARITLKLSRERSLTKRIESDAPQA
jgi:hypothetical protein